MQSSNPIFARADGFNGRNTQGNPTYPGNGQTYDAYGSPATWSTGSQTTPTHTGVPVDQGRMTIDSVVQKTGLTLGVVVVMAALTWVLTGDITSDTALG